MRGHLRLAAYVGATVLLPLLALGAGVAVVADPADEDRVLRLAVAGSVAAALAAYASLAVAFNATSRTVRAMEERARGISHGHLGRPDPVPVSGPKEVAELAVAFNAMVDQVRRYTDELARSQREFRQSVSRLGEALAATHDTETILGVAVDTARTVLGGRTAVAWRREADHLMPVAVEGDERARRPLAIGRGLAGEVAATGDRRLDGGERAGAEPQHEDALAVPLIVRGEVFAVIGVYGREPDRLPFSLDDLETLAALVQPAGAAIENARLHTEATRLSITDGLTGLANRRELDRRAALEAERHARFGEGFALLLVDLDDFKVINDELGHPAGDSVLIEVAERLRAVTREVDVVARYGGEELAVLLPKADSTAAAIAAVRVRKAIADRPFLVGGESRRITCSVGVAALPQHAADLNQLVDAADAALYRAKRAGKNRVERAIAPEPSSPPRSSA